MPRDAEITVLRALATCIARDAGGVRIREGAPGATRPPGELLQLEVELDREVFWRAVYEMGRPAGLR